MPLGYWSRVFGCMDSVNGTNLTMDLSGCFLKWWYTTIMGFPTKNDDFGVFWGYHHLRKHPSSPFILFSCSCFFFLQFCWYILDLGTCKKTMLLKSWFFCQKWWCLQVDDWLQWQVIFRHVPKPPPEGIWMSLIYRILRLGPHRFLSWNSWPS